MSRPVRSWLPVVLAVLALATGCGAGTGGTGTSGFYIENGINRAEPVDRKPLGAVSGETLEGAKVSVSDYRGKVVVINVWGSWCGPCRSEADDLAVAAKELAPKGVVFLGINTRDNSPETALAFQTKRKVPYSSIYDPGGSNLLVFPRPFAPRSIPSTVVIDAEGRVAAIILGEVTSAITLVDVVEDVIK